MLHGKSFNDLTHAQSTFDTWREEYNFIRPHEGIGMATPSTRYRPSPRSFPETLPPIEYASDCTVRSVQNGGAFSFKGKTFQAPKAFAGHPIGLRPTPTDGVWFVFFLNTKLGCINQKQPGTITKTLDQDKDANVQSQLPGQTEAGSAEEQPAEG